MKRGIRIKICGLTRTEDILAANRLRPDYVGFVFAPSRRRLAPDAARALREKLDPAIPTVGVFVNEAVATVAELCADGVISLVQLHGDEDEAYLRDLRSAVSCPVIQAVRVGETLPALPGGPDYLLFDALSRRERGGTGQCFDWSLLRGIPLPYFLAGGIGPDNVLQALAATAPFCIDVSSAVETDGKKDPEKMERLISLVRPL